MTYLEKLTQIINLALIEDHVFDDITSDSCLDDNYQIDFAINSRQDIILSGIDCAEICFQTLKSSKKFANSQLSYQILRNDGDFVAKRDNIISGTGDAKLIFAAERIILNTLQHMSGISSLTNKFVTKLSDPKIRIIDTRKTTIGLREIEKYAVKCGSGYNHRNDLSDAILIKDNHIATNSDITNTVLRAINANKSGLKIIVECDNLDQVREVCDLKIDRIMLDNMDIDQIQQAIEIIHGKVKIEASGGVNLNTIEQYRGLDIDYISVGALTHSAVAVDIGLDVL